MPNSRKPRRSRASGNTGQLEFRALSAVNGAVEAPPQAASGRRVAALFAGVGGLELGLSRAGHDTDLFCEVDASASAVLHHKYPGVEVHSDVRTLGRLPSSANLLTAGFPCQDLSQAGATRGLEGAQSGLVAEVFRLLATHRTPWAILENVPFMLKLSGGKAIGHVLASLDALGYDWAYRIVDARAFGLPQRRERVFIVASLEGDPRHVLLSDDVAPMPAQPFSRRVGFGFYWTEGVRGLGAAVDAVPTLKGGSTIGIPSPPAILMPDGTVVMPDIRDGERLQGLPEDWTRAAEEVTRAGFRWKLVGNAVCARVAEWLGERLSRPGLYDPSWDPALLPGAAWPNAAWSIAGHRAAARVSTWPVHVPQIPLHEFLRYPGVPLSAKAAAGFLGRARSGSLRFPDGFLAAIESHLARVSATRTTTTRTPSLRVASRTERAPRVTAR